MSSVAYRAGAVIAAFLLGFVARADERHIVHENMDCGSFTVEAITELTSLHTASSHAYRQSLKIFDKTSRTMSAANLDQHRSHSAGAKGMWLDTIASFASCFRSRFGRDYLFVWFGCWNTKARTCSTAMGAPGSEWYQLYDLHARALTGGQNMTDRDQKRLDHLGIEFRLLQQQRDRVDLW